MGGPGACALMHKSNTNRCACQLNLIATQSSILWIRRDLPISEGFKIKASVDNPRHSRSTDYVTYGVPTSLPLP